MSEWGKIPLSRTTKFVVDNRGKTAPTDDNGIPLIATNCVNNTNLYPSYENLRYVSQETYDTWFRSHPQPGDILLTLKGSQNGAVCLVPDPVEFVIAQDMVALRIDENIIDPLFLFAALRSPDVQSQIKNLDVSGVIPHLKKSDFDKLMLPYPDPPIQKVIGEFYFRLSRKIDLLHRQNKTLETIAATLFRQWFIEEAQDDWEEVTIGDFVELNRASTDKNYPYQIIEYLDTGSLTEGKIESFQSFTLDEAPSRAKRLVQHNDVLISTVRPDQKHYGIIKNPIENLVVSTGFCVITCTRIDPHFIYLLLTNDEMTSYLHTIAEGSTSTYPSLRPSDISAISFQLPLNDKLKDFSAIAHHCWEKIEKNHIQICTLEKLRDTLLPKLMSGEVKVND